MVERDHKIERYVFGFPFFFFPFGLSLKKVHENRKIENAQSTCSINKLLRSITNLTNIFIIQELKN